MFDSIDFSGFAPAEKVPSGTTRGTRLRMNRDTIAVHSPEVKDRLHRAHQWLPCPLALSSFGVVIDTLLNDLSQQNTTQETLPLHAAREGVVDLVMSSQ